MTKFCCTEIEKLTFRALALCQSESRANLRLRRLCSDDSDFSKKSQEMCQFFKKRGYPASVIQTAHHRAQQTDRQSALQTSEKEKK